MKAKVLFLVCADLCCLAPEQRSICFYAAQRCYCTEAAVHVPVESEIVTCGMHVVCMTLPYILITVLLSGAILRA